MCVCVYIYIHIYIHTPPYVLHCIKLQIIHIHELFVCLLAINHFPQGYLDKKKRNI